VSEVLCAELLAAEEVVRTMELLGRAAVTIDAERAEDLAEYYAERAAIEGEPGFPLGLSNSPTRSKRAGRWSVEAASAKLRRDLPALAPADRAKARLALMRRSVGVGARGHEAARERRGFRPDHVAFLTLTYRAGEQWEPHHIKRSLDLCRKWLKKEHGAVLRYVWVAELQEKRGARTGEGAEALVHYHAAVWLPHGVLLPFFDACGWWPHGASKVEAARDAVGYLMKYLSKGGGIKFPPGIRTHGAGGLEHAYRRAKRWLRYPSFIKARADIDDDWRPATGGGWWDPDGVLIPAEFARAWVGDRYACIRVADYGRPFNAGGPFSWVKK
jgi:hypothetical protein